MVTPMIALLFAAMVGGLLSFIVLWPYGALTALLGAQLGASLLTLTAGLLLASQKVKRSGSRAPRSGSIASLGERRQSQVRVRHL